MRAEWAEFGIEITTFAHWPLGILNSVMVCYYSTDSTFDRLYRHTEATGKRIIILLQYVFVLMLGIVVLDLNGWFQFHSCVEAVRPLQNDGGAPGLP